MGNVNIFEFIGVSTDPIYEVLNQLSTNEEIFIDKYIIRRTAKFYEIENRDLHECFREKEGCYQFLSKLLIKK
ncbi:hypothetical protein ACIQ1H_04685 [Lysinibacillus sp. NPDC097279]|uniref:hypothetical protein n=1 Tax=unclassified Lysinibacillus TaxID=2636778 RepID=UPI00116C8AE9|nr:hypothetical protein [Lysinibacillus sp. CD3-6]QPQ35489.1 hypothetical protein JNUCC52_00660 [Lysinibacillus sp. JNUCC-52]UED78476.1 hypothetical protein FH508_0013505 [Lysinibacillus sp. CD3-6]